LPNQFGVRGVDFAQSSARHFSDQHCQQPETGVHLKITSLHTAAAACLSLLSPIALAHPGHGLALTDGVLHPLTGFDHLLAMLGIGLWAARQNGAARWLVPASFVTLMATAAWLATLGHTLPFIESGIATSVLLIGLLIAFAARLPAAVGVTLVGMFAVFHGVAHGIEMPASGSGWVYGTGFLGTTVLLHAAGFFIGTTLNKHGTIARISGAGIAACGGFLALQALH
jgi:urease accessory protein